MQTVELSGEALVGLAPPGMRSVVSQLPQTVMLGRKSPAPQKPKLKLSTYLRSGYKVPTLPVDWASKAMAALSRMYLNDLYGCCVISDAFHRVGVWTANSTGTAVVGLDSEVLETYRIWNPGTRDDGCVISEVLDYCKNTGITVAGQKHKIDGYVSVDWTNWDEVLVALYLFGTLPLGINLPRDWTTKSIWDVTSSPIVGGHDVPGVAVMTPNGIRIASWGRIYEITKPAFTSRRWLEEAWAVLSPDWYANAMKAPNLIDAATLKADLAKLGGGTIPDISPTPDPIPPPTPVPIPPGGFDVFDFIRKVRDTIAALRQYSTDHDFLALLTKLASIWGIHINMEAHKETVMTLPAKITADQASELADNLEAALPMEPMTAAAASGPMKWDWLSPLLPFLADLIHHIFGMSMKKAVKAVEKASSKKKLTKAELSEKTVDDLREYARDHEINLHGAHTKDEIVEAIVHPK